MHYGSVSEHASLKPEGCYIHTVLFPKTVKVLVWMWLLGLRSKPVIRCIHIVRGDKWRLKIVKEDCAELRWCVKCAFSFNEKNKNKIEIWGNSADCKIYVVTCLECLESLCQLFTPFKRFNYESGCKLLRIYFEEMRIVHTACVRIGKANQYW